MEKTAAERVRWSHSTIAVFGSGYGKRIRNMNRCYHKFLHFLSKYSDLIEKSTCIFRKCVLIYLGFIRNYFLEGIPCITL